MDVQKMDKAMVTLYRDRWKEVNEFQLQERREASILERWDKLNSIIGMAVALGVWPKRNEEEISQVRERWNYLRRLYLAEQEIN